MARLAVIRLLAVLAGAVLLVWPAFLNGYPLVFSDTAALANMAMEPTIGWDKPWVYGPFLLLTSWQATFWGTVAAQGLIVSDLLWRVVALFGAGSRARIAWRHLGLCSVLAIGSTAPWFTALLMPDVFTPVVVLCLFLLAYGRFNWWLAVLATVAIGVHLAHLIVAAACVATVLLLRPRRVVACAVPLAAALCLLLATNAVGNGVLGISPYGSVFALARLQADGPAVETLRTGCPALSPHFCAWADRLPMDSDAFLWAPDGPIWGDESGPTLVAAEASRVVSATVAEHPWAVAVAAWHNTLRQVAMVRVGDALVPNYLADTVGLLLRTYFPSRELHWFEGSREVAGTLPAASALLVPLQLVLMAASTFGTALVAAMALLRGDRVRAGLAALVMVGVLANAAATGALSGPHNRYSARIGWLLLLPPMMSLQMTAGSWPSKLGQGSYPPYRTISPG